MGPLSALCGGGSFHSVNPYLCGALARVLGIDFGLKRTGVAVTDPLQIVVNGLTSVESSTLMGFVTEYLRTEEVESLVIGVPGQPSEDFSKALDIFVADFQKAHPQIKVVFHDEDFSSINAREQLRISGVKQKARRDKKLLDQMSAAIILREFLHHV